MPSAVLIVGLCGCGKSHLASELEKQGFVRLDESFEGRPFAADPGKALSTDKFNELKKQLAEGKNCAFTEAMLMSAVNRAEFEPCLKQLEAMPEVSVEWVFFANDPDSANHNCRNDPNRTDGEKWVPLNDQWSRYYTIPVGHTPRPITRIPEKKTK
jgi:hypothetical protein